LLAIYEHAGVVLELLGHGLAPIREFELKLCLPHEVGRNVWDLLHAVAELDGVRLIWPGKAIGEMASLSAH
jgi:hypothetical protein